MGSNPAIALFLALGLIIAASRIGGALARRLKQPRVLGELLIGVILGPTVLNMLHWSVFHGIELEEMIRALAELGVLLLMFLIGLEVNVYELVRMGKVAVFAGFAGALLPVVIALPMTMLFDYQWQPALFAGVTLAATSVSISAQVLLELGFLQTREGNALLATALVDDVLAILLLSLTIAVIGGGETNNTNMFDIILIVIRMSVFIAVAFGIAWFILPIFMSWLEKRAELAQSYGLPAFALIIALIFGWSAQEFGGIATITGAFIAGVGLSQSKPHIRHEIESATSYIAYAFLVPIFFVDVGLEIDLNPFPIAALPLAGALLLIAIFSKIVGCGLGAKLGGFTNAESFRVGVCMISRGEVGLIIASVGVSTGILQVSTDKGIDLFASLFLVILLTTLLTPILVRMIFPHPQVT